MGSKHTDIRYKWLQERGINIYKDEAQLEYMKDLWDKDKRGVFCEGKAGTGKTVLAILAGAYAVEKEEYDRIIYVRNTVPVRDMGFLKGDDKQKIEPYMQPMVEALDMVKAGTYEVWSQPYIDKARGISTAFVRGLTWDRSYIILDEIQNFSLHEIQSCFTRVTDNSKIVATGSLRQVDNEKLKLIKGYTPFEIFMMHYLKFDNVAQHELTVSHRSPFADWADEVQKTISILEEKKICQKAQRLGQ